MRLAYLLFSVGVLGSNTQCMRTGFVSPPESQEGAFTTDAINLDASYLELLFADLEARDLPDLDAGDLADSEAMFKNAYYLSTDASISSADVYIGDAYLGPLTSGQSQSNTRSLVIPLNTAPGTGYYLGMIADYNDTQPESDEGNNALALGPFEVICDIDLQVTALTSTATSLNIGEAVSVSSTVQNSGTTSTTASFNNAYYLSTDASISSADVYIGNAYLGPLTSGQSQSNTRSLVIPLNTAPGTGYYLGMIADYNDTEPESDEGNNALALGPFEVIN